MIPSRRHADSTAATTAGAIAAGGSAFNTSTFAVTPRRFDTSLTPARTAATIRSRDLDLDIITNHIRRLRDQLADEIARFIHQRSAPAADGAMIADIAAHSLATAVFAALEAWMGSSEHDIDELSRLTDTALRALEEGLTHTLRHVGLD